MARKYDPQRAPNPADLEGAMGNPAQMAQVYGLDVNGMSPQEVAELARQRHEDHQRRTRNYNVVPDEVGGFRYTPNENMLKAQEQRRRQHFLETHSGRHGDQGLTYDRLAQMYDQHGGADHMEKARGINQDVLHKARVENKQAREAEAKRMAWQNYHARLQAMQAPAFNGDNTAQAAAYLMQMEHMNPGGGYAQLAASLIQNQNDNASKRYGVDVGFRTEQMRDGTVRFVAIQEDGTKRYITQQEMALGQAKLAQQGQQFGQQMDFNRMQHRDQMGFNQQQHQDQMGLEGRRLDQQQSQYDSTLAHDQQVHGDTMGMQGRQQDWRERQGDRDSDFRDRQQDHQETMDRRGQRRADEQLGLDRDRVTMERDQFQTQFGEAPAEIHDPERYGFNNGGISAITEYARRRSTSSDGVQDPVAMNQIVSNEITRSPHYPEMIELLNDITGEGVDLVPDSWFTTLANANASLRQGSDLEKYRAFLREHGLQDSNALRRKYGIGLGLDDRWLYESWWDTQPVPITPYGG